VIEGVKPGDWVHLNSKMSGFFRVLYTPKMFAQLLEAFKNKELDVIDRYNVASDVLALLEAGKITAGEYLQFIEACKNEDEYVVWNTNDSGLATLSNVLSDNEELKGRYNKCTCNWIEPAAKMVHYFTPAMNEDSQVPQLRNVLLNRLARALHKPTIETALEKFREHANSKGKVDLQPDLRKTIYGIAARTNDPSLIADLKQILETVDFSEVETNCIIALGQVTDPALLKDIFDYGITQKRIRSQDWMYLFAGAASSKVGRDFAWKYIQQNFRQLVDNYGSVNSAMFQRCVTFTLANHNSEAVIKEFENFCATEFAEDERSCLDMMIRQSLESMRNNCRLKEQNEPAIASFLDGAGY
jgi:aminopeptidase N